MIERLNFYDIYGYLIPGLALLGVVWFPFWFVAGTNLPAAWSSALVALVLGYIMGHLLQRLAREAFPQGRLEEDQSRRFPSDYILDPLDPKLTGDIKTGVAVLIQCRFGLDVAAQGKPDARTRGRRQDAFFLCRRVLIQQGVGSYAEQFEGMYALMRGLAAVSALSFTYHLGWAAGPLVTTRVAEVLGALLLLLTILLSCTPSRLDHPRTFWTITAALIPVGMLLEHSLGPGPNLGREAIVALIAAAFGVLFMARQFHGAYQFLGVEFAATVYRDIYALDRWAPAPSQK
jgi:hypothetical protein